MSTSKPLKIFFYALDGCIGHRLACLGIAQALAARGHQIIWLANKDLKGEFTKLGFGELLMESSQKGHSHGHGHSEQNKEHGQHDHHDHGSHDHKHGHEHKHGSHDHSHGDSHEHKHDHSSHHHSHSHGESKPGPDSHPLANEPEHRFPKPGDYLIQESPLEKLRKHVKISHVETLYDSSVEYHPQIEKYMQQEKPDIFIMDHFMIPPVLLKSGIPWVYIFSPSPLGLLVSPNLPPLGSGCSTKADPSTWAEYAKVQKEIQGSLFSDLQKKLNEKFGYSPPTEQDDPYGGGRMFPRSKYLNIYGYPKELDYTDVITIPSNCFGVDGFVRYNPEPFDLPEMLRNRKPGQKLIYFSLGSRSGADVDFMRRILSVLEKTPHKYIVSKGPKSAQIELPSNCWGEAYLPQTKILPLVDLVITHAGNNTITETFSFGKPMIALPLGGDQLDNAQRLQDTGLGVRLDPATFTDEQLSEAIERLLADEQLNRRLAEAAQRIETYNSKDKAAERIELLMQ